MPILLRYMVLPLPVLLFNIFIISRNSIGSAVIGFYLLNSGNASKIKDNPTRMPTADQPIMLLIGLFT